ncbi:hypothetical protein [Nocardia sp. XZ_19_369]|uniref:hypothetical protein n=1 Tax=Nocardia sp. XZ_19_369 TaxID=2769487 RepID=UPI00188FF9E8|nr:hypothetical protein [Nocardia sp. XZ_19_369]
MNDDKASESGNGAMDEDTDKNPKNSQINFRLWKYNEPGKPGRDALLDTLHTISKTHGIANSAVKQEVYENLTSLLLKNGMPYSAVPELLAKVDDLATGPGPQQEAAIQEMVKIYARHLRRAALETAKKQSQEQAIAVANQAHLISAAQAAAQAAADAAIAADAAREAAEEAAAELAAATGKTDTD